jgi:hypothetical protein
MKIEIEVPDIIGQRRLVLVAGTELIAEWYPFDKKWKVKKERCSRCGKCCKKLKCDKLGKDGDMFECGAGGDKPWSCIIGHSGLDCCTEVMEYVK